MGPKIYFFQTSHHLGLRQERFAFSQILQFCLLVGVLGVFKICNFVTFCVLLGLISSPIPVGLNQNKYIKFEKQDATGLNYNKYLKGYAVFNFDSF